MSNLKRVVVTGMGVASPVGNSVLEAWNCVKAGRSGIGLITLFDTAHVEVKIAGEVRNFDPEALFGRREARRLDRAAQLALFAAHQAMQDSGLSVTPDNHYYIGCIIGTGIGGIGSIQETFNGFAERGFRGVIPTVVPRNLSDNISARISMEYGLRGPNYTVTSACATGNNSIGEAADLIRLGRAKAMLTGATEAALVDMVLSGFNNIKTLSQRFTQPDRASRPFDLHRDGFVASEGAAVLVLEELEHALRRDAPIYAEVTGYGHTSDAYHVTAPLEDGESAAKAMEFALAEAGLQPDQIDYINAHGTATQLNDHSETLAIKKAFGEQAYNIPVSSTKSMTGHLLGAAAALEAVLCIEAMRENFIPPTINLDTPDPDCDLDYTPHVGRSHPIQHVMSNSFGFGGHNIVVVFSRYHTNGAL